MEYTGPDRRFDNPTRHEFDGMSQWVKDIDQKMTLHTQQEIRMEHRLDELEKDVNEIKNDVKQLLEIWTEAKGAMRLVVWIVGALASVWGFVIWAKDHIKV